MTTLNLTSSINKENFPKLRIMLKSSFNIGVIFFTRDDDLLAQITEAPQSNKTAISVSNKFTC